MTRRDAFVLGVVTHCKLAELDSDDTIALVDLLLSDPKTGMSIIKRARADLGLKPVIDRMVKEAGKWGRRIGGTLGLLGGGTIGVLASAPTGFLAAIPGAVTGGYMGYEGGSGLGDWLTGYDAPETGTPAAAASPASAPQKAAQQTAMPPISPEALSWLRERGVDPESLTQGRYPGSAWGGGRQWGGMGGGLSHIPPDFTRTTAPGGAPTAPGGGESVSDTDVEAAGNKAFRAAMATAMRRVKPGDPVDPNILRDASIARSDAKIKARGGGRPQQFAGMVNPYIERTTDLSQAQIGSAGLKAFNRQQAGRSDRRLARLHGLSLGQAAALPVEQMLAMGMENDEIMMMEGLKKRVAWQSAGPRGKPHTAYGTGFGTPDTAAASPITTAAATLPQPAADPEYEKARAGMQAGLASVGDQPTDPDDRLAAARAGMRRAEAQLDRRPGAAQPYAAQAAATGGAPMPEEGTPEWDRAKSDYVSRIPTINSWLTENRSTLGTPPGAAPASPATDGSIEEMGAAARVGMPRPPTTTAPQPAGVAVRPTPVLSRGRTADASTSAIPAAAPVKKPIAPMVTPPGGGRTPRRPSMVA